MKMKMKMNSTYIHAQAQAQKVCECVSMNVCKRRIEKKKNEPHERNEKEMAKQNDKVSEIKRLRIN